MSSSTSQPPLSLESIQIGMIKELQQHSNHVAAAHSSSSLRPHTARKSMNRPQNGVVKVWQNAQKDSSDENHLPPTVYIIDDDDEEDPLPSKKENISSLPSIDKPDDNSLAVKLLVPSQDASAKLTNDTLKEDNNMQNQNSSDNMEEKLNAEPDSASCLAEDANSCSSDGTISCSSEGTKSCSSEGTKSCSSEGIKSLPDEGTKSCPNEGSESFSVDCTKNIEVLDIHSLSEKEDALVDQHEIKTTEPLTENKIIREESMIDVIPEKDEKIFQEENDFEIEPSVSPHLREEILEVPPDHEEVSSCTEATLVQPSPDTTPSEPAPQGSVTETIEVHEETQSTEPFVIDDDSRERLIIDIQDSKPIQLDVIAQESSPEEAKEASTLEMPMESFVEALSPTCKKRAGIFEEEVNHKRQRIESGDVARQKEVAEVVEDLVAATQQEETKPYAQASTSEALPPTSNVSLLPDSPFSEPTASQMEDIMEIDEGNKFEGIKLDFEEEDPKGHLVKSLNGSKFKMVSKQALHAMIQEKLNSIIAEHPLVRSLYKRCQVLEKALSKNRLLVQTFRRQLHESEKKLPQKPTVRTVGVNVHINQTSTRTVGITVSMSGPTRPSTSAPLSTSQPVRPVEPAARMPTATVTTSSIIASRLSQPSTLFNKPAILSSSRTAKPSSGVIDLTEEEGSKLVPVPVVSSTTAAVSPSCMPTTSSSLMPMPLMNTLPSIVQFIPTSNNEVGRPSILPRSMSSNTPRLTTLLVPHGSQSTILLKMNAPTPTNAPTTSAGQMTMVSGLYNTTILKGNSLPRVTYGQPRHPAPLPRSPIYTDNPGFKLPPPKPKLTLSKVNNGIVLSWSMRLSPSHEVIQTYELYAYQETGQAPSTTLWKKVGDVRALPLPMACTLTQFVEGNKYHFAVRGRDNLGRFGTFSDPTHIFLTP